MSSDRSNTPNGARRGGLCCCRAARRQERRLVELVGADESCSDEDGASLGHVWSARGRERKAF